MSDAVVTLRKGAGRTLKQGGPWIYDNEIESIMGSFEDGDIVIVHDYVRQLESEPFADLILSHPVMARK